MENKINYGRMILGGILAAVVLFAVGYVVHAIILNSYYEYFQTKGSVMPFMKKYGMLAHIGGTIISGICLSVLYVVARKFSGPGPMTAIKVGFVVGLFAVGGISAEYAFYNLGKMIPAMTLVDNIAGCILATLVSGAVYKD